MIFKQATELTLRNGEKLQVTLAEGNSARQAKGSGQSKSIIFPSIKNRMIDASFIVDIQDKSVEDHDAMAKEQLEEHKRHLISTGLLPPEENSKYGKGYISYIVASIKLRKKSNKSLKDIRARLDEKQLELVNAELAKQSLTW